MPTEETLNTTPTPDQTPAGTPPAGDTPLAANTEEPAAATPSQTSTPSATPQSEAPKPAAAIADIASWNKKIEEQEASPATSGEEPDAAATKAEVDIDDAAAATDADKATEDDAAPAEAEVSVIAITKETPYEEYIEQRKAYLETVEITPELQAILDYQDAQIEEKSQIVAELDNIANRDQLVKIGSAMNRLFETEIDPVTGTVKVNAQPFVEVLTTDFKHEVRPIAEEMLSIPSTKYTGTTMLEEILIDQFGHEKAQKMVAFGFANAPLPIIPQVQFPQGVEDGEREAYLSLPQNKKFQIQGLVDSINELEQQVQDPDNLYMKEDLTRDLEEKRLALDTEIHILKQLQQNINFNREQERITNEQKARSVLEFRSKVNNRYNQDLLAIRNAFAEDLAPKLSYADQDTQLSQARNVLTRVTNALGFQINEDGGFGEDPFAEQYAKELKEEGVSFDFKKGRDLLRNYYTAVQKLEGLQLGKASPQAINIAERELKNLEMNIKVEQKQLLGQLTSKYVKSHGTALNKQVDEIKGKKQAVRSIQKSKPAVVDPKRPIGESIAEYNARLREAELNDGESLYNFHAGVGA